jgi:hypothetical protein
MRIIVESESEKMQELYDDFEEKMEKHSNIIEKVEKEHPEKHIYIFHVKLLGVMDNRVIRWAFKNQVKKALKKRDPECRVDVD